MTSTLDHFVGNTPLVRLQRIARRHLQHRARASSRATIPPGSVKDRPALSMIMGAEQRGEIKPGDTLIEATSGNTGIALAMVAAMRGYRMVLVMPENLSVERRQTMAAFGAHSCSRRRRAAWSSRATLAERMRDAARA